MSKSIISNEKECFLCKSTMNLHKHHIYPGALRDKSEQYGCWIYLCAIHHNMSNEGIHFNREFDKQVRALCQKKFNQVYPDKDFIKIFKKSYL